ncbi:MAG: ABC transporter permease subunit, partial [Anaerotignum sp.]|nr:ABC transporter permease subunit [Anaerotignum sp.]
MPKKKNLLPKMAMAGPVSLWMILFVTIPLMYIIFISFMSRGVFGDVVYNPTVESYQTILDPTYFKVIIKSLQAAGVTTLLCILIGYPFAYIIARKPKDTAAKMITLLMIPFWTNSLMRLNAWLLLFQTSGPVNNFLMNFGLVEKPISFIYTDELVLIGLITNMLPFAVLPLYSTIEKLEKSLLEASADLGADAKTTFMKVTLPITFPGIFAAIIL